MDKIRIFIGEEPNQWLATEVLRWSILRHTKAPVEIKQLQYIPFNLNLPASAGTAFYRFYIPEACGFEGRAIYLESDTLILSDIEELFQLDMQEKGALATSLRDSSSNSGKHTNVMLLDCANLKNWNLKFWSSMIAVQQDLYHKTMWAMNGGLNENDFGDLPAYWNDFDHVDNTTKILHFANFQTYPWKKPGHPYGAFFLRELKSGIESGQIPQDLVEKEIKRGSVYSTLLDDMNRVDLL